MSAHHAASPRVRQPLLVLSLFLILSLLSVAPALAQQEPGHESHWGVAFSATPTWTMRDNFRAIFYEGDGATKGSELTIGVARGSNLGGDIGISYVRKPFKDGSGTTDVEESCFSEEPPCSTFTTKSETQGVYLEGVEVTWFWAAATIKNRLQIGLKIGGGIASAKGNIVETRDFVNVFRFGSQVITEHEHSVETIPAKDVFFPVIPLFRLQAEGAVILVPGLKAKITGGLNFPGMGMTVGLVYLFGAK